MLAGVREGLSEKHRKIIENDYAYHRRPAASTVKAFALCAPYLESSYDWTKEANCRDTDEPEVFFPGDDQAKLSRDWESYCDGCPVRRECLEFGTGHRFDGIWGGVYLERGKKARLRAVGRLPVSSYAATSTDPPEVASEAVVTS